MYSKNSICVPGKYAEYNNVYPVGYMYSNIIKQCRGLVCAKLTCLLKYCELCSMSPWLSDILDDVSCPAQAVLVRNVLTGV